MKKLTKEQVAVMIETAYLHGMYDWAKSKKGDRAQLINNWADGKIAEKIFQQYSHKS